MRDVIIIRGTSGSGKNTFAEILNHNYPFYQSVVICCADDYMINQKGEYDFKPEKLGYVHKKCQERFEDAINGDVNLIIVSNTNTKEKDFKFYIDTARKNNYRVFSLVLENRHNGKNIHGVNNEVLDRQENNLKSSLKLR